VDPVEAGGGEAGVVGEDAEPGADRGWGAQDTVLLGEGGEAEVGVEGACLVVFVDLAPGRRLALLVPCRSGVLRLVRGCQGFGEQRPEARVARG